MMPEEEAYKVIIMTGQQGGKAVSLSRAPARSLARLAGRPADSCLRWSGGS
jgi:hypothetical protein